MSKRIHLTRPPRDDDELYHLVTALWGITIPRYSVCPDHDAPFDAFSNAFFAREPMALIHGSRGLAGKSRLMSVLGLTNGVVWGADTNILGGSLAQSNNVLESMAEAWRSPTSPKYMIKESTQTKLELTNEAKIRPLTASQRTVRGPHPPRLLLDEIDEMDLPILDAALGQPMPQKNWLGVTIPAQTTMGSTWQYADGTFTTVRKRFVDNNLPIFTWCYRESANPHDGWLSPEFIEQKKREIPREMWRVEYELGEPSIGNRAFDTPSVERMFDEDPPEPLKVARDYEEYCIEQYRIDRDYVVAADWAKQQDYTVITVWDVTYLPIRMVYYLRFNRQPYPVMIGAFNKLQQRYFADGIHDATGLGGVVADLIEGTARNFLMTGRQRDDMLTEYVSAVENDRVKAARINSIYSAHKYCTVEDLYSRGQDFHLPDEVCSAALAWKMVSRRFPAVEPVGLPKSTDQNWMAKQLENSNDHLAGQSEWRLDGQVRVTDEDDIMWSLT